MQWVSMQHRMMTVLYTQFDKDMKQIPGQLFDMNETFTIDKKSGWEWFLIQTLAGDQTDGYAGAPGFGVKLAQNFCGKWIHLEFCCQSVQVKRADIRRCST